MPVVLLVVFVYVFGGTLGNGITVGGGRGTDINFLTPGMLLFTVVGAAQITAISVAKDMTEGIIARFKTMPIWRPAVLAGHVSSSLVLTLISLTVTIAVALLIGYHAAAGPLRWLAALGVLVLLAVALIWLSVALVAITKPVIAPTSVRARSPSTRGPCGSADAGHICNLGDYVLEDWGREATDTTSWIQART